MILEVKIYKNYGKSTDKRSLQLKNNKKVLNWVRFKIKVTYWIRYKDNKMKKDNHINQIESI